MKELNSSEFPSRKQGKMSSLFDIKTLKVTLESEYLGFGLGTGSVGSATFLIPGSVSKGKIINNSLIFKLFNKLQLKNKQKIPYFLLLKNQ